MIKHSWLLLFCCTLYAEASPSEEVVMTGGKYYVGNIFGQHDYAAHSNVMLNSLWIMRTEVTFKLYNDIHEWAVGHGYEFNPGCNGSFYEDCLPSDRDNGEHPVTNVEWSDAIVFANAISEKKGLKPVYLDSQGIPVRDSTRYEVTLDTKANGYRLPTLEEWQIAARGGNLGIRNGSYGDSFSGSKHSDIVAWFPEFNATYFGTSPVKQLKPNALGLYDMSGNVSEWVYAFDTLAGVKMYYFCGGSFMLHVSSVASCDTHSAGYALPDTGFRLVRKF